MPQQRSQIRELIAVLVDILHAPPQTRLQLLRVVPEQQHDHGPRQAGEGGPRVVADLAAQGLVGDDGEADAGLDGEARKGEGDAGEDVDDDLLVDGGDAAGALGAGAEDEVAADEAAEEAVVGACMNGNVVSANVHFPLEGHLRRLCEQQSGYANLPCLVLARST